MFGNGYWWQNCEWQSGKCALTHGLLKTECDGVSHRGIPGRLSITLKTVELRWIGGNQLMWFCTETRIRFSPNWLERQVVIFLLDCQSFSSHLLHRVCPVHYSCFFARWRSPTWFVLWLLCFRGTGVRLPLHTQFCGRPRTFLWICDHLLSRGHLHCNVFDRASALLVGLLALLLLNWLLYDDWWLMLMSLFTHTQSA